MRASADCMSVEGSAWDSSALGPYEAHDARPCALSKIGPETALLHFEMLSYSPSSDSQSSSPS